MFTLKRLKTLLLGLAVIFITFTVFVALPVFLPPLRSLSCERVMMGCAGNTVPVSYYHTFIWDDPNPLNDENSKTPGLYTAGARMKVVSDAEQENRINVSGYLLYFELKQGQVDSPIFNTSQWRGGLAYRPIKLTVEGYYHDDTVIENLELTTDDNGLFSADIEFEKNPDCYAIFAEYEGESQGRTRLTAVYYPCEAFYTSCKPDFVYKESGSLWWVWLIFVLAIITALFLLFRYLKRLRRYIPERLRRYIWELEKEKQPRTEDIVAPKITEKKEGEETGGDLLRVEIGFPDIEVSFPSVWGVGESLTVQVKLKDSNGEILPSQPCNVDFGDGETVHDVSDTEGYIRPEHIFNTKGEYVINGSYQDSKTGKEISSWRRIRIVEYREEMVRLFNEMLETLNIRDIRIEPEMTAREIEVLLEERMKGVPTEAIRKIVAGFEEANYSVHPVTRESYVAMYPVVREVLDYGG